MKVALFSYEGGKLEKTEKEINDFLAGVVVKHVLQSSVPVFNDQDTTYISVWYEDKEKSKPVSLPDNGNIS